MTNESVITPSPGVSVVDAVDGPVVDVVVMEECVDVGLNDEEASSEVLEPEEQEQEQEGSKRQ